MPGGHRTYRFAVKCDTDALFINPCLARLDRFFDEHPTAGVTGSFRVFPDGEENKGRRTLRHVVAIGERRFPSPRWLRRWHRDRPFRAFRQLAMKYPRRRSVLARARTNGYQPADHVVGGAYAISGRLLQAWLDGGWLPQPHDFESSLFGEDLLVAVCSVAAGFELVDFNGPGDVFGVWWEAPTMPPSELADAHFGIVHSVKYRRDFDETQFRQWFRTRRQSD